MTRGLPHITGYRVACGCDCGCQASIERDAILDDPDERRMFSESLPGYGWALAKDRPRWLCSRCRGHEGMEFRDFELHPRAYPFEAGESLETYAQRRLRNEDGGGWELVDVSGRIERLEITAMSDDRPRMVFGEELLFVKAQRRRAA